MPLPSLLKLFARVCKNDAADLAFPRSFQRDPTDADIEQAIHLEDLADRAAERAGE